MTLKLTGETKEIEIEKRKMFDANVIWIVSIDSSYDFNAQIQIYFQWMDQPQSELHLGIGLVFFQGNIANALQIRYMFTLR